MGGGKHGTVEGGGATQPPAGKRKTRRGQTTTYVPVPRARFQPSVWLVDVDGRTVRGPARLCVHSATVGKLGATTYHAWLSDFHNTCTFGSSVYGDLLIGLECGVWVSMAGTAPHRHTVQRVREGSRSPDESPDRDLQVASAEPAGPRSLR